jgi:hypothetical protein
MDFEAFDDEWLNLSPLPDLWPSPSPAATATQLTNEPQSDDSLDDDSGDDDGLYGDASPGGLGDDCSESSFGDEEQVVVAAEQYSWKIDHAKGDHKFRGVLACCTSANSN